VVQGYLIARPTPEAELASLIQRLEVDAGLPALPTDLTQENQP
jgi:hypothetical protein